MKQSKHSRFESLEQRQLMSFTVVNAADSGAGSLRQAILDANANPGADVIDFNIPGTGLHFISPATALPAITDAVTISGYSQPGSSANTLAVGDNANPTICLNGFALPAGSNGLTVTASNTVIKGLQIFQFPGSGVVLNGAGNNAVTGCFIGTKPSSGGPAPNGTGVLVLSSNNVIGETGVDSRNVISGNLVCGVDVRGQGNVLRNNYVGTDTTGLAAVPNTTDAGTFPMGAITLYNGGNTVGGTLAGAGNVIAGNRQNGILAWNTGDIANAYQGNYIGLGADGDTPIANTYGIYLALGTRNNLIGGTTVAARNVISANNGFGIVLDGADGVGGRGAVNTTIQGNYIGTDKSGTQPRGFGQQDGIYAFATKNLTIGGPTSRPGTGAGNVISSNNAGPGSGSGIVLGGTTDSVVKGNVVGLKADGTSVLGEQAYGIVISGARNQIGGNDLDDGNVFSGNTYDGVHLESETATGNVVLGNAIGLSYDRAVPAGNGRDGVRIVLGANRNDIGTAAVTEPANYIGANGGCGVRIQSAGTDLNRILNNRIGLVGLGNHEHGVLIADGAQNNSVSARNTITHNDGAGIAVTGAATLDNVLVANNINWNGGLGIDLGADGITPNDPLDADSGPDSLQNSPVLTSANLAPGNVLTVDGVLQSTPNSHFVIIFYMSPSADPSGYGEGEENIGTALVDTDAAGNATIHYVSTPSYVIDPTWVISATASQSLIGGTSEFSKAIGIIDNTPPTVTSRNFEYETRQALNYTFSEDVSASLSTADLQVQNLTTGTFVPAANVSLVYAGGVARFSFVGLPNNALADGNYRATLLAPGITDASGNPMAANHVYDFFFLNGDANRDRHVDVSDLGILATSWHVTPRTFSQGDFNYDGTVDVSDLGILATSWSRSLPAPSPALARGATDVSPTRSNHGSKVIDLLDSTSETIS
jgi:hypothetical protein